MRFGPICARCRRSRCPGRRSKRLASPNSVLPAQFVILRRCAIFRDRVGTGIARPFGVNHEGAKETKGTKDERLEELSYVVIGAAIAVHRRLGPGLLESAYRSCLAQQLLSAGVPFQTEVALPVVYGEVRIERAYRIDFLVDDRLIIEVKAVADLLPVHKAQLLTYLKLADIRVGLLFNFNVTALRQGICRLING